MNLLTGENNVTLDDKGRLSLPSRLRGGLKENVLVLTKGLEKCIWVFPPEQWERVSEKLMASASLSLEKSNWVQHRFIVPAQPVEFDKAGRFPVPQSLRDYAGLSKDCKLCGVGKYMEIWSVDNYAAYVEENEPKSKAIMEELGPLSLLL
ncbi:MAG: division/cell wall cluster transcriptional repressor MraZ [Spirochaetaceae bacterium]|jgi:MraZ protein|nr:division/cell wall cluster transcriptional repressor MraZ [Spirochaetaceae bacterium]